MQIKQQQQQKKTKCPQKHITSYNLIYKYKVKSLANEERHWEKQGHFFPN